LRDQVIARVLLARGAGVRVLRCRDSLGGDSLGGDSLGGDSLDQVSLGAVARAGRRVERPAGDLDLAVTRAARQLLDRAPVEITGGKVQRGEIAFGTEHRIDQTHALDQFPPIDRGNQAHAGDDVADGDVRRTLTQLLAADHLFGGGLLRGQTLVQPRQRRDRARILFPQPLDQLHRERRCQRAAAAGKVLRRGFGFAAGVEQPIGKPVGLFALCQGVHDQFGQTAQILQQHDAQRNCDRPELADGEDLHPLIGGDEAA